MSPNKRKILALEDTSEDDSSKHRRSSMRVNLSYCENLTDSGNGSLWRTENEPDNKETDAARMSNRLSRSKRSDTQKERENRRFDNQEDLLIKSGTSKLAVNKDSNVSLRVKKKGIQLKRLTVDLEDINLKEKALETSCKRLKDAILNKTKEIFDRENELSKKTMMILQSEENIHDTSVGKSVIILDPTANKLSNKTIMEHEKCTNIASKGDNQHSNIIVTPTTCYKSENSKRVIDKSRLTQKRLFPKEDKQAKEQAKCKIIRDIILKDKFPLFSVRQTDIPPSEDQNGSPILSGSNRRLSLQRTRSKLHSQNPSENHDTSFSTINSQSRNIGAPIVSSTFNEDTATGEKETNSSYDEENDEENDDMDTSRATHTTNRVISMEITEVHGGIRMSEKRASLQSTSPNMSISLKDNKEKSKRENLKVNRCTVQMQRIENVNSLVSKLKIQNDNTNLSHMDVADQDIASGSHTDTVIPMQTSSTEEVTVKTRERGNKTKNYVKRPSTLSPFDNNSTIRSSLNVNTSLDAITEGSKEKNLRKSKDCRVNNRDFKATTNVEKSVGLDEQYESSNSTKTSLKMNTSVNSTLETWKRRSNLFQSLISDKTAEDTIENHSSTNNQHLLAAEKANDVNSLENISLIQRLRNISTRNQVSSNNKITVSNIKEKEKTDNTESNETKRQSSEHTSNSGDSYVEGTPYPVSRSVLFRTLLRQKAQTLDNSAAFCGTNLNLMDNKENNDKTKSDEYSKLPKETDVSTKTSQTLETNTILLEDTNSDNPVIQDQLVVIEDTADETRLETSEKDTVITQRNMENVTVRRGRRRLLPFDDNSRLCSISPTEKNCIAEEEPTSPKRNKKRKIQKKKRPKRKSTGLENDTSCLERDNARETWPDNDMFKIKKKKKEKVRKPRKVISKKIVIKKFADENMLNVLKSRQKKEDQSIGNGNSLDDDFEQHRTIPTQLNIHKSHKIVIAMTGLSKGDKSLVRSIVKSLGRAEVELNVSRRTTHVVSTGVRTANLLRAIIRGCWLVTVEWVLQSLENNGWLNPEKFEMKHFSKAVQENRKDRQLFGPSYVPELFATCGFIHVELNTAVPCDTLKELVKTAGGHVTENPTLAKIVIGANGLKETWIMDSITTGELQATNFYKRN